MRRRPDVGLQRPEGLNLRIRRRPPVDRSEGPDDGSLPVGGSERAPLRTRGLDIHPGPGVRGPHGVVRERMRNGGTTCYHGGLLGPVRGLDSIL